MIIFNTDNMVAQEFPFPAPIMDYIYKNISATQLLKLYKTCKFFYDKFRLNIIEDFELSDEEGEESIVGNSLAIWQHNPAWLQLNNLWISKSFTYCKYFEDQQPLELEHEKFSRLTYDTLHMHGEKFTVKDYEFLIKPLTLQHFIIDGAIYNPETEQNLSTEQCLEYAPHVTGFFRDDRTESSRVIDMKKLLALERHTKLTLLQICGISKVPDPLLIIEFFKKHAVPDLDYYFDFDIYDEENVKTFFKTIDAELRAWKLSLYPPPAVSTSFIDLTGKIALITGATNGIGKAATLLFRQLGASVVAVARDNFQLKTLGDECRKIKTDGIFHTVSIDPSENFDVEQLIERIDCRFGSRFDILVVNVDPSSWNTVRNSILEKDYRDNLYVLQGHLNIIQAAAPYLAEAKGCIINASIYNDLITKPEDTVSIANMKRRLKIEELELATAGVRTNTVNCGTLFTTIPRPEGMNDAVYKKYLQNLKKSRDDQAANAIAFLASDTAKSIEGAVLPVNALNLL